MLQFYAIPFHNRPSVASAVTMMLVQRASTRRIQNVPSLLDAALELGFCIQITRMEELTMREQIHSWFSADAAISATSAALVHLVMMRPGSHYIEVPMAVNTIELCYYRAHAEDLQIRYHSLCGSWCHVFNATQDSLDVQYQDLYIQEDHLVEFRRILHICWPDHQISAAPQCSSQTMEAWEGKGVILPRARVEEHPPVHLISTAKEPHALQGTRRVINDFQPLEVNLAFSPDGEAAPLLFSVMSEAIATSPTAQRSGTQEIFTGASCWLMWFAW